MLRPIQDPVPGMWLSISHVNRSFSCWISHYVSFLLLPYYRFLSWKLYPSDIKTNLSSSILLDDAANTQTKRMDILKEIHCSQTTATKNQNIARDVRADLVKGQELQRQGSVLSAPWVSEIFQCAVPWKIPIQEHLTQCRIFDCDKQ